MKPKFIFVKSFLKLIQNILIFHNIYGLNLGHTLKHRPNTIDVLLIKLLSNSLVPCRLNNWSWYYVINIIHICKDTVGEDKEPDSLFSFLFQHQQGLQYSEQHHSAQFRLYHPKFYEQHEC